MFGCTSISISVSQSVSYIDLQPIGNRPKSVAVIIPPSQSTTLITIAYTKVVGIPKTTSHA